MSTDIRILIATSSWSHSLKFTQKTIIIIEAQLSVLKSHVDCELSTRTSKIEAFSDSLKTALSNLQNRDQENSKIDLLQQNITIVQNELRSKVNIIKLLLETQKTVTNSYLTQRRIFLNQ